MLIKHDIKQHFDPEIWITQPLTHRAADFHQGCLARFSSRMSCEPSACACTQPVDLRSALLLTLQNPNGVPAAAAD
jgi:hypothetical protein